VVGFYNGEAFSAALASALAKHEMKLVSATLGRSDEGAVWVFSITLPDGSITTLYVPVKDGRDPHDVELTPEIAEKAAAWWAKRALDASERRST
jgi:hypothetical protein